MLSIAKLWIRWGVWILVMFGGGGGALADGAHIDGRHNQGVFASKIGPLMSELDAVARVYYYVPCQEGSLDPVPFPSIAVDVSNKGEFGLAALRRTLYNNNTKISIREDPQGIIRLRIGRYIRTILDVKIGELKLSSVERYSHTPAIWAVINSDPVRRVMGIRGIHQRAIPVNMQIVMPYAGAPHLPEKLTNQTVDQIFDTISQTFNGIIIYGSCPRPLQFEVNFFEIKH